MPILISVTTEFMARSNTSIQEEIIIKIRYQSKFKPNNYNINNIVNLVKHAH